MDCKLGGAIGYWLLKAISKPRSAVAASNESQDDGLRGAEKLERFLGNQVWEEFAGQRVLDFGCGSGGEAVAAAHSGAEFVYGVDIQDSRLEAARRLAEKAGVADRCRFLNAATEADEISALEGTLDCAYSIDSFEHYERPEQILEQIHRLLAPGGRLLISFGPPWKNPYGSHMWFFNRWPWIHLAFREETIMAVRSLYRADGARKFEEVDGGLNRMTLQRFLRLVESSPFELDRFRPVPLSSRFVNRPAAWQRLAANRWLREYLTSVVLCRLTKPIDTADFSTRQLVLAAD